MNLFINYAMSDPFYFFSWVFIVTFSICVHEYAHAIAAVREGDDTPALLGHLTLNPLVQMGWSSMIMLLLFGIAWGAVPVNVARMRSRASGALVAFAGPAANLVLSILFGGLAVGGELLGLSAVILGFFAVASLANGVLFLFNMLPIPMFDGWAVASLFFPGLNRVDVQRAQTMSWMFLAVVWLTPVGSLIWASGSAIGNFFMSSWSRMLQPFT